VVGDLHEYVGVIYSKEQPIEFHLELVDQPYVFRLEDVC